jgi:aminoglycoside 6'-N-acetyltransferase I
MEIEVRVLGPGDASLLGSIAPDVFDHAVSPASTQEFLADPRHHLAVALDAGTVIGVASAVDYIHPDKPRELWINEVGVSAPYCGQGVARRLLRALLEVGRERDCRQAWVLTNRSNGPAMRLYRAVGGVIDEDDSAMFTFRLDG